MNIKKLKGASTLQKVGLTFLLVIVFVFALAFAVSGMGFIDNGEAAPEYSDSINSYLTDGCEIPSNYLEVFNNAVKGYNVSPALIAAIFYAGEHYDSNKKSGYWPNIEGPWENGPMTSTGTAKGPFQFKDATWDQYGMGGNVQDINDAAKGASNMFDKNIAAGKGDAEHNIKNAIKNYNSSDEYVERVYKQFKSFSKCLKSYSGEMKFTSLDQVKTYFGTTPEEIGKHLKKVSFLGKDIQVNEMMVDDLKKAESQVKKSGYKVETIGTYNFRANVNDTSDLSAHAFGLAIDINPKENPNTKRPVDSAERDPSACKHDIPQQVVKAFEDNNFFWGARYKEVCDAMHFQYGGNWQ